jgi:hypothetical protein
MSIMKKSPLLFLAVVCTSSLGLFTSCSKTGPAGAPGARGAAYEGDIAGFVSLFDQYGKPTDVGLSGIQLTLDSVENPLATATTISTGYYIFPNRFTGLYSLKATSPSSDPAYGSVLGYFQYLADTLTRDITMSAQANFAPSAVTMTSNSALGSDSVYITLPSADPQARQVIVFVGNSSTVSSSSYLYAITITVPVNKTKVNTVIQASTLNDVGITSGGTVYLAVYGEPVADKSVYASISTGQNVYTALSASSVTASAQVP